MKTSILITFLTSVLFSGTLASAEILPAGNCAAAFDRENSCVMDAAGPSPALPELLTAYLVDRSCEEPMGKEWRCRKKLLVEYENYTASGKEISPQDLPRGDDSSSGPVFHRKESMIFHMLEDLVGKDPFSRVLRGFTQEEESGRISWDDLKTAVEKASDKDLEWFFDQWLRRNGIPSIEIRDPKVGFAKDVRTVSFEVVQKNEPFRFDLPLVINTDEGEVVEVLKIEKEKETFEVPVQGNPSEIIFDRDYDLMRRLSQEEHPPVISGLLGDEKKIIVIPGEGRETYDELIESVKGKGAVLKDESKITDEDIRKNSLLVLGCDSPVLRRLFGGFPGPESGFTVKVKKNPLNESKVVAIACTDSKEELSAIGQLSGYAGYSYVRFKKGRNVAKDTAETERGIRVSLAGPILGIQPRKAMGLDEIILKVFDKPLIYVGERHANFEDHRVELEVIRRLYESGRKVAIGMEMFQRPFQRTIDAYLAGAIGEREFLKTTQYFKRWQFDYNLYREIVEYAKAKGIPVIALNMWTEIVKTVAMGGLDALTDSERAQIFPDMDMSDEAYKERLREVFDTHKNLAVRDFDNFYQAQILWDETMAHSADEFLKKNPDYQMVVLAGVGHIIYGSGIPKRAFRLNGKAYATLIPAIGVPDEDSADFVLFPEHLSPPASVRLGVILKKTNGNVRIEKVQPASCAERAGLMKGDVLISLDDSWMIEDVDDVRIYLFDKKKDQKIKIKALRKKFLTGYKEIEFNVSL